MELSNTEAELALADLPVWFQLRFIVCQRSEAMKRDEILEGGGFFLAGYREEKAAVTMTVRIVLCWGENRKKTGCECARRTGVCGCVEYLLSVWRHKPEACFNTYVVNTLCNRTRYEVSSLPVWISSVTSVTPTAIKINKVFDLWLLIGPWTFSVLKSCINIHVSHSHTLLATVNMFRA